MVLGENFSYPITTEYDNHLDDSGILFTGNGQKYKRAPRINRCGRIENCRVINYRWVGKYSTENI